MRYYNKIYRIDEMHFMTQVKKEYDNTEAALKRLYEEIESIKKYQLQLHEKAQEILNNEYDYCIVIDRYNRDNVQFEIRYIKYIKDSIPSHYQYTSEILEFYNFFGKERKEALNLATKLSKEYNCKLIKRGFNKR